MIRLDGARGCSRPAPQVGGERLQSSRAVEGCEDAGVVRHPWRARRLRVGHLAQHRYHQVEQPGEDRWTQAVVLAIELGLSPAPLLWNARQLDDDAAVEQIAAVRL